MRSADNVSTLNIAEDQERQEIRALEEDLVQQNDGMQPEGFLLKGVAGQRSVAPIAQAKSFFAETPDEEVSWVPHEYHCATSANGKCTVVFHDPSALPDNPGWPLRNILYYLHHIHGISFINVVCLRSGSASRKGRLSVGPSEGVGESSSARPQAVGWERNKAGKLASRVADLGPMLDPSK